MRKQINSNNSSKNQEELLCNHCGFNFLEIDEYGNKRYNYFQIDIIFEDISVTCLNCKQKVKDEITNTIKEWLFAHLAK